MARTGTPHAAPSRHGTRARALALGALALLLAPACLERTLKPLVPCTTAVAAETIEADAITDVDLVFVIDDSLSMREEQASLAREIPRLVGVLATGDSAYDPVSGAASPGASFPPVQSLHVAVVSTDLGATSARGCDPGGGDRGVFRTRGTGVGCAESYPPILAYDASTGASPVDLARDVSCVSTLGTEGCGLEQQLEAAVRALTTSSSKTQGHADLENAGFLRPDSMLAVVLLTDEDDCSTEDVAMQDQAAREFQTGRAEDHLNVRCAFHPERLYPIERFVEALLETRTRPDRLLFAAITGIPLEAVGQSPDAILASSAMQVRLGPPGPSGVPALEPSCNAGGDRGVAYPARRITEAVRSFEERGAFGVLQSICQADYSGAVQAIIDQLSRALDGSCLPRALAPDAEGRVECEVVELLPTTGVVTRCEQLAGVGRSFLRSEEGREVCTIAQAPGGAGVGWFYDASPAVAARCPLRPQRIAFTPGSEPGQGVRLWLECLEPVVAVASGRQVAGIGTACTDAAGCAGGPLGALVCDAATRTCQHPCATDADCPASLLCDAGRAALGGAPLCVNPICGN